MSGPTPVPAPVPAALTPPPLVASVSVLLDDAHSRIEWHVLDGAPTRPVFITFDPLMVLWPKPPFGLDFLLRQGADVVAVRRKSEHFYQPLDRAAFLGAVAPVLAQAAAQGRRVIAYGSSLGAYAALYYARPLDVQVVALSPRVSVHPVYGNETWQASAAFLHEAMDDGTPARCAATIVYDPREPIDRRFIEEGLAPAFPRAAWMRLPFTGHPVTQFLADTHHLSRWIRALATGAAPPVLDRRAGRRLSATWYQVTADLCARRGRLALADALVTRSLALRERSMLAHRTRGLIKTLQKDWPEALVSLEKAQAFDAADPLTQSMLARVRKAMAGGATAAPAAATGWRARLRRWLGR
jgi:predicted Zn-dependent protease